MESNVEVCANERKWFDIEGAAKYLAVKPRTIREGVWAGELERAKIGKRFIFSRASLDAWAESKMCREGIA